jgi:predicted nucleic acid-binding protein
MSRLVLDASVAVAAAKPTEVTHAAARRRLTRVLSGHDEIVVPAAPPSGRRTVARTPTPGTNRADHCALV